MKYVEIGKHLVVDPRMCFGKLTFKGTRLPVQKILFYLSEGQTIDEILEGWPYLNREAIQEAINLAAAALAQQAAELAEVKNEPIRA
jgi:uncharacterized protein (DUF433 family)